MSPSRKGIIRNPETAVRGVLLSLLCAPLLSFPLPAQSSVQGKQGDRPGASSFPELEKFRQKPKAEAAKPEAKKEKKVVEEIYFRAGKPVGLRHIENLKIEPFTKEPLPEGTLFLLVEAREQSPLLKVRLLGGFEGFVHSRYFQEGSDGFGRTTGSRVSFRHRPVAGEWPVSFLPKGSRLAMLEKEGDWWRVLSNEEVSVYVPKDFLEEVGRRKVGGKEETPLPEALAKQIASQIAARQARWVEKKEDLKLAALRREKIQELERAMKDLVQEFDAERAKKDPLEENLEPLAGLAKKLIQRSIELGAKEEPVGQALASFQKRIETRLLYQESKREIAALEAAEARAGKAESKVAVGASAPKPFDQTGWLEYRPGPQHYSDFQIVKGNEILCYVTCDSKRYRLKDYVGCKIGLRGEVRHHEGAAFKVADAARLVVLSGTR